MEVRRWEERVGDRRELWRGGEGRRRSGIACSCV